MLKQSYREKNIFQFHFTVCHFTVNDARGWRLEEKMTKRGMGEGERGSKNGILKVTYFLNNFF